jgi:hypothetical protein
VAAFGGLKKFKMGAVAMVTKVPNGCQIKKSSDSEDFFILAAILDSKWPP